MSYIRCLSNPEGLYIYANEIGLVSINHNVSAPMSSADAFQVPIDDFEGACRKWSLCDFNEFDERVRAGDFIVEEQYVYGPHTVEGIGGRKITCGGEIVGDDERDERSRYYQIKLSYKEHFVFLWRVTWEYIVRNATRVYDGGVD